MQRIAFYAPMKPPDHPVPSGEREMARLFHRALEVAGFEVELASRLRSREPEGSPERQERFERAGLWLAGRLITAYRKRDPAERPVAWFTYHLYYKAMDWIGPEVARALDIPYLAAEVSVAPKRAKGPWQHSHARLLEAIAGADCIFPLTEANRECLPATAALAELRPFLDPEPFRQARLQREETRSALTAEFDLHRETPWIAVAAMMRPGVKSRSFALLAAALERLGPQPYQLLIVGDGPARGEIESCFAGLPGNSVRFLGQLGKARLAAVLAACDLYAWPSIGEAFGVSLLEAQAAGLPVVAGRDGGVASVVGHEESGLLVPPGDAAAFADAVARLLASPASRSRLSDGAEARIARRHSLDDAAAILKQRIADAHRAHASASGACPS